MPGALLHVGATVSCPHGGPASFVPTAPRVLVGGQPVVTAADVSLIGGCAFNVSGAPHPCVAVRWIAPATRVLVGGSPAVLATSPALCVAGDQAPQGPPVVAASQLRVVGT